jgi:hypothetical protein
MKIIEVIAHNCWQKLIRMNWTNVSGYIEDAINDATAALQYEIKTRDEMIGEVKKERDGWIAEAERLKQERDGIARELKVETDLVGDIENIAFDEHASVFEKIQRIQKLLI